MHTNCITHVPLGIFHLLAALSDLIVTILTPRFALFLFAIYALTSLCTLLNSAAL